MRTQHVPFPTQTRYGLFLALLSWWWWWVTVGLIVAPVVFPFWVLAYLWTWKHCHEKSQR